MRDFSTVSEAQGALRDKRPFGLFVHHQGRGHAERCAALVNALPPDRPVRIFCARPDIFPSLRSGIEITAIPSLFEPLGNEPPAMAGLPTPDTLHCAPLGWDGIRLAMGEIATWFVSAAPALMICDVSAEVAQLARICSVPAVKVLQHGDRTDPGHLAAYDGAVGLLAPFDAALAQPDWPARLRRKIHFAGGLGIDMALPEQASARQALGFAPDDRIALAISGGGGVGMAEAHLAVAARACPEYRWITLGRVQSDWHATPPGNLYHMGWVETVAEHLAAADIVIASTGNTTTHQILAAGKPWIAVPEWRYFDEQTAKAEALARAGVALALPSLPASARRWREAVAACLSQHEADRQRKLVNPEAARRAADWLETLARDLWAAAPLADLSREKETPHV